jgi:hypothetical protein
MSLSPWEEQVLDRIRRHLSGTDPRLTALLGIFSRLTAGEDMPPRPGLRQWSRRTARRAVRAARHPGRKAARAGTRQATPGAKVARPGRKAARPAARKAGWPAGPAARPALMASRPGGRRYHQSLLLTWIVVSVTLIAVALGFSRAPSRGGCAVAWALACPVAATAHVQSPAGHAAVRAHRPARSAATSPASPSAAPRHTPRA